MSVKAIREMLNKEKMLFSAFIPAVPTKKNDGTILLDDTIKT